MSNAKPFRNNNPEFFKNSKKTIGVDLLFAAKLFCEYCCKDKERSRWKAGYMCHNPKCPIGICKINRHIAKTKKTTI